MIIGVPKEIKNNENRVALTPAGVAEFKKYGHIVYIQSTAGENSGFSDSAYTNAGAQILPTIEAVYEIAEMIIKVKEPIASEYRFLLNICINTCALSKSSDISTVSCEIPS